jgi:hypothetical protein
MNSNGDLSEFDLSDLSSSDDSDIEDLLHDLEDVTRPPSSFSPSTC